MPLEDAQFPLKQFNAKLDQFARRLDVLERPTGTSVGSLVAQVQQAVANIATAVTNYLSSGFTTNGNINANANIIAPNGTLVSLYARNHSVVSGYVALYIDSSGNVLATPSARRMKRDIEDISWTREQRDRIRVVTYRLRAAWILADMQGLDPATEVENLVGVIGEELVDAGLPEFVVLDDKGRVFTVRYELLALVAIDGLQQADRRIDELEARIAKLEG